MSSLRRHKTAPKTRKMNQKKTQNVNREKQIGAKETQNTPKSQNDISIEIKKIYPRNAERCQRDSKHKQKIENSNKET